MLHFHDGHRDFPHGAGPSEAGWYYYPLADLSPNSEPLGPFRSMEEASSAAYHWHQLEAEWNQDQ